MNKDNINQDNTQTDNALASIIDMVEHPTEVAKPSITGMLTVKSANEWIHEASERPDPAPLWLSLWHEGEVCCLFSDSNLGKSIYAVQIAEHIANERNDCKVLYFDFELSDKQFQIRYTGPFGTMHAFPYNLLRSEIDPELIDGGEDFEDHIIADIEQVATTTGAKILIIDNLSFLCNASEKGDIAGLLMMRLIRLKKKIGLSILVLAHTPKRDMCRPITQNDLAGSKKIFNFLDACFAIGMSAKDEGLRYIKQLKARNGAIEYGGKVGAD